MPSQPAAPLLLEGAGRDLLVARSQAGPSPGAAARRGRPEPIHVGIRSGVLVHHSGAPPSGWYPGPRTSPPILIPACITARRSVRWDPRRGGGQTASDQGTGPYN